MPTRIDRCLIKIKSQCKILQQNKIPFIFFVRPGKNDFLVGSPLCLDVFESHTEQYNQASIGDIRNMCDPARAGADDDLEEDVNQYDLLKTPLSLANNDEVKQYSRYMIVKDREKRIPGSNLKLIKYGDNSWEPSFWPNDMLQWTSIKKNISNLRKGDFPGPHSTLDVLREAVRRGLVSNGINPENYYDPEKFTKDL